MGFVCLAPSLHSRRPRRRRQRQRNRRRPGRGAPRGQKGRPPVGEKTGAATTNIPAARRSDENLRCAARCLDLLASLPRWTPNASQPTETAWAHSSPLRFPPGKPAAAKPSRSPPAAWSRAGAAAEAQGTARAHVHSPRRQRHDRPARKFGPAQGDARPQWRAQRAACLRRRGHNLHQQKADEVYPLMRAWFTKFGILE